MINSISMVAISSVTVSAPMTCKAILASLKDELNSLENYIREMCDGLEILDETLFPKSIKNIKGILDYFRFYIEVPNVTVLDEYLHTKTKKNSVSQKKGRKLDSAPVVENIPLEKTQARVYNAELTNLVKIGISGFINSATAILKSFVKKTIPLVSVLKGHSQIETICLFIGMCWLHHQSKIMLVFNSKQKAWEVTKIEL